MDLNQQAKTGISRFHEEWILSHFRLCRPEDSPIPLPRLTIRPDFVALTDPLTIIELKTRSYQDPNRNRDFWWPCMVSQVRGYDLAVSQYGLQHAWIFYLAQSGQNLVNLYYDGGIRESDILGRELYFSPHGIERVASNYSSPSGYYYVSLPRLDTEEFARAQPCAGLTLLLHKDLEQELTDAFTYR
jgi:hypothetical protein